MNRTLRLSLGTKAPLLAIVHELGRCFLLENGTVKSFDDVKRSGWIVPADGTKDLFVHQRNIREDVKTLPINAKVTYEPRMNDRGLEAINVSLSK